MRKVSEIKKKAPRKKYARFLHFLSHKPNVASTRPGGNMLFVVLFVRFLLEKESTAVDEFTKAVRFSFGMQRQFVNC